MARRKQYYDWPSCLQHFHANIYSFSCPVSWVIFLKHSSAPCSKRRVLPQLSVKPKCFDVALTTPMICPGYYPAILLSRCRELFLLRWSLFFQLAAILCTLLNSQSLYITSLVLPRLRLFWASFHFSIISNPLSVADNTPFDITSTFSPCCISNFFLPIL